MLTPKLVAVSRKLCEEIQREWQILLIGEEQEGGIFCYDYFIPKQETGAASVKNNDEITLEFVQKKKIVATMHSHNEIACSFSHTDDQCTNHSFIKHHIVTNNRHDFMAISRIELPCELIKFAKATVVTQVPTVNKVKGIENIEERAPLYPVGGGTYFYDKKTGCGYYGNQKYLPKAYTPKVSDGKDIKWKKTDRRNHAFGYDQKDYGGFHGF